MSAIMAPEGEPEDRLPRSSPFVGALRHAPKRSQILLLGQLDRLLRRRIPELAELGEDQESHGDAFSSIESSEKLPSSSPYVGFQRHAPPSSPVLSFT
ncbi:Alpha-ketoglutarate-dependent taurine dioxygenase, partial [Durusdinium trenchii]